MKNFILSLILLWASVPLFSQNIIKSQIIDASTQKPISFANVGVQGKDIGTVSDENGNFELEVKDEKATISVFTIGYEQRDFSVTELLAMKKILLNPKSYNLQIVEVDAKRLGEELILGFKHTKKDNSIGFSSTKLGAEIGALIDIDKESVLRNANFVINHTQGDSAFYRVNIYKYENEKVGENLLTKNVIIREPLKKGIHTVDLLPYNIVVDHPVILALEWIKDDNGKGSKGISFNSRRAGRKNNLYLKTTSFSTFYRLSEYMTYAPELKLAFYFTAMQVEEE